MPAQRYWIRQPFQHPALQHHWRGEQNQMPLEPARVTSAVVKAASHASSGWIRVTSHEQPDTAGAAYMSRTLSATQT